jgi:uncharacterized protein (DUF1015 family)
MADVRPFRALRYAPGTDLAAALCPPFDVISPALQREMYERSRLNAVRIELADESLGDRYDQALNTLGGWLDEQALRRDATESFYVYRQTFEHGGQTYSRTILFARVRLAPWDAGEVLPHEQTFGGPKEDRLRLMRAIRMNTSPIYLLYRDAGGAIGEVLAQARELPSEAEFTSPDGQSHEIRRVSDPAQVEALREAFPGETLFVADGHHRYETALAYRDEARATASEWTGEEPANFVMVALTAASDPGLLVLPIHRVTNVATPVDEAMRRVRELFDVEPANDNASLTIVSREGAAGLRVKDAAAIDALLPRDRSPEWRSLDYSIANHVVLQHCLGLTAEQMRDYSVVWFTEDAEEAAAEVRSGKATYAVLMRPVPVERVLELAEAGERMPQKSTFFYPKVPTGLVFNPLWEL